MATFKNGQLIGKVGNLVAYRRNGKIFMKKTPERKKPPTEGELKNRYLLELVQGWLNPIQEYLKFGFRNYHPRYDGINAATSLLYKQGLIRDGYNSSIDPSQVRVSWGPVGLPETMAVSLEGRILNFSWSTETSDSKDPRDGTLLLAYNISAKATRYELCSAHRSSGSQPLSLTPMPAGTYHLYLAFVDILGKGQSPSSYLGSREIE